MKASGCIRIPSKGLQRFPALSGRHCLAVANLGEEIQSGKE